MIHGEQSIQGHAALHPRPNTRKQTLTIPAVRTSSNTVVRATPAAALAPGFTIPLVVLCFSPFGDGLHDALDPTMKNR